MEPAHLQDDLRMEVMMVICELPDNSLFDLYNRRRLEHYTTRVIINMIINKYSPFFKKYRMSFVEFSEETGFLNKDEKEYLFCDYHMPEQKRFGLADVEADDIDARAVQEEKEERALGAVDDLHWYDAGILRLYLKHGNYRAIQQETNIPFTSCYKTVQKAIKELKKKTLCSVSR
jgi:hypothetical protein